MAAVLIIYTENATAARIIPSATYSVLVLIRRYASMRRYLNMSSIPSHEFEEVVFQITLVDTQFVHRDIVRSQERAEHGRVERCALLRHAPQAQRPVRQHRAGDTRICLGASVRSGSAVRTTR